MPQEVASQPSQPRLPEPQTAGQPDAKPAVIDPQLASRPELNPGLRTSGLSTPDQIKAQMYAVSRVINKIEGLQRVIHDPKASAEQKQAAQNQLAAINMLPRKFIEFVRDGSLLPGVVAAKKKEVGERLANKGIAEAAAHQQEQHLVKIEEAVNKMAEEARKEIESNQTNPKLSLQDRALAYDMGSSLATLEERGNAVQIAQHRNYLAQVSPEDRTTIARVNGIITNLETKQKALAKKREELTAARGKMINDVRDAYAKEPTKVPAVPEEIEVDQFQKAVTVFAYNLAEVRLERKTTPDGKIVLNIPDETKAKIANDPLGYLEEELASAAQSEDNQDRVRIGNALGITDKKELQKFCEEITI